MKQTRKQSKVLCYTGMNHKKGGVHTPEEFLKITNTWRKTNPICHRNKTRKNPCPPKGDLKGWIKWSGAIYADEKKCRKEEKQIENSIQRSQKLSKKYDSALKKVNQCETRKCSKQIQEVNNKRNEYYKNQQKACSYKSKKYAQCDANFYNASNFKQRQLDLEQCSKTKCKKERNTLKKQAELFFLGK